jgi:hypothetical protein
VVRELVTTVEFRVVPVNVPAAAAAGAAHVGAEPVVAVNIWPVVPAAVLAIADEEVAYITPSRVRPEKIGVPALIHCGAKVVPCELKI